jgi:hypothetical protein
MNKQAKQWLKIINGQLSGSGFQVELRGKQLAICNEDFTQLWPRKVLTNKKQK